MKRKYCRLKLKYIFTPKDCDCDFPGEDPSIFVLIAER